MKRNGFTLLETMVAISILLTALGGPFVVTQVALRTARKASQELVATGLAQEGVEYIRYWRDTNAFRGNDWIQGLMTSPDCIGELGQGPETCVVDALKGYDSEVFYDSEHPTLGCGVDNDTRQCPALLYDEVSGLFTYEPTDDTQESIYRRALHMEIIRELDDVPVELKIISEVVWEDLGVERSIQIESILTNWR